MSAERAESYLRQFAESQLRRIARGETTAEDGASRIDAVAAAFEGTGVLGAQRAADIAGDFDIALAARSPGRATLLHRGRRAPVSTMRGASAFSQVFIRSVTGSGYGTGNDGSQQGAFGEIRVFPAGAELRLRADSGDEDVYLLALVVTPARAWLTVAARASETPAPRRHASPPSARSAPGRAAGNPPATFAGGGLTATDDAGRRYQLRFSGGGGQWYLGRLTFSPVPPPGTRWLAVSGGDQTARLDLTAPPAAASVSRHPAAASRAEAYLLGRAEMLLAHPALAAAEAAGLGSAVPALRAVGALSADSAVPGQVAALCERLGAPGRVIADPAAELPPRWAGLLAARPPDGDRGGGEGDVAAAHLAVVLPAADGVAVALAGLLTRRGEGTVIFGALRRYPDDEGARGQAPSLWLRDDAGAWHGVSINGWSADGGAGGCHAFQASVVPPLPAGTTAIEFFVTGPATEVRAAIPLSWWRH